MTRESRDRKLSEAARGYHEPPPVPRERMWARIDEARAPSRWAPAHRWWSRREVRWPAAVAAALVAGLLIGRLLGPVTSPTDRQGAPLSVGPVLVHDGRAPDDSTQAPLGGPSFGTYRRAARPVLARSETLLMQVRAASPGEAGTYSQRASDLLAQTRLLLASPAGEDRELAPLLNDLELALARLVQLADTNRTSDERQTLEDGLERKSVLPRIRDQLTTSSPTIGL
jgi:hypothetical protein